MKRHQKIIISPYFQIFLAPIYICVVCIYSRTSIIRILLIRISAVLLGESQIFDGVRGDEDRRNFENEIDFWNQLVEICPNPVSMRS